MEAGCSNPAAAGEEEEGELVDSAGKREKDEVRVKRKALNAVLEKCQRALQLLSDGGEFGDDEDDGDISDGSKGIGEDDASSSNCGDADTDELYDMIKSQVGGPEFLQRIENAQASASAHPNMPEDGGSWDMVCDKDLWECEDGGDQEDYVLVRQEDIVDGIACFMAAYLISLKQTKDLSPNKLQEALRKTFSVKKRKGKLQKAWDGSRAIYNVASWSATAIGIYQNPALLRAASTAFWTSCRVISKLL